MARIQILSREEENDYANAPKFSLKEREYYFKIPTGFLEKCSEIKPKNMVFILIQYGYFRTTNRFYKNLHEIDILYIKENYSLEYINQKIPKSTLSRYYNAPHK